MSKVVVIDYGIGNVFSVCNGLKKVGAEPKLTRSISEIMAADRIILPGVGAFGKAIEALRELGLDETLERFRETERPFLGICIGMQLAMEESHEFGVHKGLGYVPGVVSKIPETRADGEQLAVPHIAWTNIAPPGADIDAWNGTPLDVFSEGERSVYFVHSYHCQPSSAESLLAISEYGGHALTGAIRSGSFIGVQFHPERSGPNGLRFLDRFVSG